MITAWQADAIVLAISVALAAGYHIWVVYSEHAYSRIKSRTSPASTIYGVGVVARVIWVEVCAESNSQAILAVQTARNAMSVGLVLAQVTMVIASAGVAVVLSYQRSQVLENLRVRAGRLGQAGTSHN